MKDKLALFIKNNMIKEKPFFGSARQSKSKVLFEEALCDYSDVNSYINGNKDENKFQRLLFKYIDDRDLKDSDVYNKVHIDRRLFSKIRSDEDYHPSKDTVILLGLSLELNINEFMELLNSASYTLAYNNHYDLIIRFCFIEGIYKISDVNELLSMYNCKLFSY